MLSHLDLFLSIQPITGYLTAGNLKYKTALEAVHLSSAAWREWVKVLSISKCVNVYKDTSEDVSPSLSELLECAELTQSEPECNNNIASICDTWRRQRPVHDLSV